MVHGHLRLLSASKSSAQPQSGHSPKWQNEVHEQKQRDHRREKEKGYLLDTCCGNMCTHAMLEKSPMIQQSIIQKLGMSMPSQSIKYPAESYCPSQSSSECPQPLSNLGSTLGSPPL